MKIVISGTVGVGKTTISSILCKELKKKGYIVNNLQEKAADSPFLSLFYNEPESWVFISQIHFLFERFRQLIENEEKVKEQTPKNNNIITIYDRHILDDYIFSQLESVKKNTKTIDSIAYKIVYDQMLEKLEDQFLIPDYFFLAYAPIETIVKRLNKRGRKEEANTNIKYWQELYDYYYNNSIFQNHFKKYSKNFIKLNTNNLNPEKIVELIVKKIKIK